MSPSTHAHLLSLVRRLIPPLSPLLHKGQAGRIGVLGGSGDYSGAPYFAAAGAMRFGADLAHVICEPSAAAVIKTYSPDLIVHGILDEDLGLEMARKELKSIMERLHVLIVGPGLGRSSFMQSCAREALALARDSDIGVVVDADGLWLVQTDPNVVRGFSGAPRVVLTPNVMEFKRLCEATWLITEGVALDGDVTTRCAALARRLGSTVIQKGGHDHISNGIALPGALLPNDEDSTDTLVSDVKGGLKRVGGQGDILSGSTGVLLAWGREWARGAYAHVGHEPDDELAPHVALIAAYGASVFNRTVSRRGWERFGRSLVTGDLVDLVGPVYEELFGRFQDEEEEEREEGT